MRPGWNAGRKNRNQGTRKRGRGQDNRLVIPCCRRSERAFYDQLRDPVVLARGALTFYIEAPRAEAMHSCSPDDIAGVLQQLPAEHVRSVVAIVLRQSTRKQALLSPCWGRMVYARDSGERSGPAIFLEAQPRQLRWLWPLSNRPADADELERLRRDGHRVTRERRGWRIESTPGSIRATQLYRTLLHELGHHVDYLTTCDDDVDRFFARPHGEREAAAHRYADDWAARLRAAGTIPFAPRASDGVDPAWFEVTPASSTR